MRGKQRNFKAIIISGKQREGSRRLLLSRGSTPCSPTGNLFELHRLLKEPKKTERKFIKMKCRRSSMNRVAQLIQAYGRPAISTEYNPQHRKGASSFRSITIKPKRPVNLPISSHREWRAETSCFHRIPEIPFISFECSPNNFSMSSPKCVGIPFLSKIEEEKDNSHYEEILHVRKMENDAARKIQRAFRKYQYLKRKKIFVDATRKCKKNITVLPLKRMKLQAMNNLGNITITKPTFRAFSSQGNRESFSFLDLGASSARSTMKSSEEEKECPLKKSNREFFQSLFNESSESEVVFELTQSNLSDINKFSYRKTKRHKDKI